MHEIVKRALSYGYLLEPQAMDLLELYGIPVQPYIFLPDSEIDQIPNAVHYPVVAKVVSPQIIHKSDVGGVRVNIRSEQELITALPTMKDEILSKVPQAEIHGWKIDSYLSSGLEIILGAVRDRQFDMALMIGIGGVFTEVINDTSFRIVPVTGTDVDEMLAELKTQVFFKGFRGNKPIDSGVLKQILMGLSRLVDENPVINEVDLNPVICNGAEIFPVDARIILTHTAGDR